MVALDVVIGVERRDRGRAGIEIRVSCCVWDGKWWCGVRRGAIHDIVVVGDGPINGLDDVSDGIGDVVVGIVDRQLVMGRGGVGIVVGVRRERGSALLRLGGGLGRLGGLGVKSGLKGLGAGCHGLELPFEDTGPILRAFFVKLVFPLFFCFLTVLADVATLVAAGAIAPLDVVVQQPLGFRGNLVAFDNGFEVGTLQAVRELDALLCLEKLKLVNNQFLDNNRCYMGSSCK